jgi:hypothetical protein
LAAIDSVCGSESTAIGFYKLVSDGVDSGSLRIKTMRIRHDSTLNFFCGLLIGRQIKTTVDEL